MDLKTFQYAYPKGLIAQHPLPKRDASRMMVLHCAKKRWEHQSVRQLPEHLRAGDVLVLNDTRVFPARLNGTVRCAMYDVRRERNVEILLLEETSDKRQATSDQKIWRCLGKPLKKINVGQKIHFAEGLTGVITTKTPECLEIKFEGENVLEKIEKVGLPPLPPYIQRKKIADYTAEDKERYQSLFARNTGSAAAPTASLHFSEALLKQIRGRGVEIAYVTLHISTDTFLPIREEDVTKHKMHGERFFIPKETQAIVKKAKSEKRRVIAVGATAARALESDWTQPTTHLFIYPGYQFKIVDGLLTNFHQPSSTLILLVSALVGREFLLEAYQEAIAQRYRLFSYGDCMLIL